MGVSAGGSARSFVGPGVGGGERKATFFCTSAFAALPPLLLLVLRELRPAESLSMRDGAPDAVTSRTCGPSSLPSGGGSGTIEPVGVGWAEEDSVDEELGSSTGGSGREEISGNGLKTGVAPDRGGQSGRRPMWGIFSLGRGSLSLSFSFERPRLKRLRNAFIVVA